MKRKIVLKESELVNIINKVINEAETANCKCCKAGVRPVLHILPSHPYYYMLAEGEKKRHRDCCRACEREGNMVSNDGRRRKFNEQM